MLHPLLLVLLLAEVLVVLGLVLPTVKAVAPVAVKNQATLATAITMPEEDPNQRILALLPPKIALNLTRKKKRSPRLALIAPRTLTVLVNVKFLLLSMSTLTL
jgi:hypothetical protein